VLPAATPRFPCHGPGKKGPRSSDRAWVMPRASLAHFIVGPGAAVLAGRWSRSPTQVTLTTDLDNRLLAA